MASTDELGALGPLLEEYAQVEAQMADPQTLADPQLMRRVGRRYAELGRVKARQKVRDEFPGLAAEAFEFVPDGSEEEMRASAEKLAALTAGGGAKGLPRKGGGVTPADGVEAPFNAAEFVRSIPRM